MGGLVYPIGTGLPMAQRSLDTQVVRRFKGLNRYSNITNVPGDWASDLLNVIVNGTGGIAKLRLPVGLTPVHGAVGPDRFFDFQQGNGVRQIFANFGNELAWFDTAAAYAFHTIETLAADAPEWDWSMANNILFGANGQVMKKWTGAALRNWGGAAPATFDPWNTGNFPGVIASVTRAGNVVTAVLTTPADLLANNDFIIVNCPAHPSFSGIFRPTVVTDQTHIQWAQNGINEGPFAATYLAVSQTPSYAIPANQAVRVNGVTTITLTLSSGNAIALGPDFAASARPVQVLVAGVADASFNGVFSLVSKTGNVLVFNQSATQDATSGGGTVGSNLQPRTGYSWAYSWKNSVTGHVTNRSPVTPSFGGSNPSRSLAYTLFATAPTDAQFDTLVWWRTLDGGSNWYLVTEQTVASGLSLLDIFSDGQLDQTQQAPLLNNPPPVGLYVSVWAGRVFVFNIVGAPQDVAYSGYEKILVGRPEESFPSQNRLRLSIGADAVAGGGAIQAGIIAFSKSQKMYMYRGVPEDISVSQPVLFSAYLEELPWQIGCMSHYTICSTPYGLVFLASDRTVMQYDGTSRPVCISAPIHPLLKTIRVDANSKCKSSYFTWLDKDWYCLTVPIANSALAAWSPDLAYNTGDTASYLGYSWRSLVNANTGVVPGTDATRWALLNSAIFFFDLEGDADLNCGIFYSDLEADDIRAVEDIHGQKMLCISANGQVSNLQVELNTVNGIGIAPRASTGGVLTAFWQSGYFGNETPQRRRLFRYCRFVADAAGFAITANLVEDDIYTFQAPKVKVLNVTAARRALIDVKSRRCSLKMQFPNADADANLVQLLMHSIATSER